MRKTVKIQKKLITTNHQPKRYVYTVTIPERILKELGWKEGTELMPQVLSEDVLVFKKVKK